MYGCRMANEIVNVVIVAVSSEETCVYLIASLIYTLRVSPATYVAVGCGL